MNGDPEAMAAAARELEKRQDDEVARLEPSIETALQLRETLKELRETEERLLDCDLVEALPIAARHLAEAHERATAALHAVCREAGVAQVPVEPRRGAITTRG